MENREEKIRRRAFEIWERNGRPEGGDADHWLAAEREIDEEFGNDADQVPEMSGGPETAEPGTIDQRPRWEGPPENRPAGYLPAEDDPSEARDAAGESLKDPDRSSLSDAFVTKNGKAGKKI